MIMRRLLYSAAFAVLLAAGGASAQTSPGLTLGQIPTPAQWNGYFSAKQDYFINGIPVANGGTGATTAANARSALAAAASGANTDITSISGLTTPLSLAQGGTGSTIASSARYVLGAAASGANTDITSISGLTTPLSLAQGGTGSTTATGAIINLGVIDGTPTTGHCVQFFSATQIVDSGATCGTGSGVAGVSTFDGRSGTVSLTLADVTGVIPAAVTVASLPTCASGQEGQRRSVSDALSPSFAAPVYGGGTVHIGVGCNGSAWITGY